MNVFPGLWCHLELIPYLFLHLDFPLWGTITTQAVCNASNPAHFFDPLSREKIIFDVSQNQFSNYCSMGCTNLAVEQLNIVSLSVKYRIWGWFCCLLVAQTTALCDPWELARGWRAEPEPADKFLDAAKWPRLPCPWEAKASNPSKGDFCSKVI